MRPLMVGSSPCNPLYPVFILHRPQTLSVLLVAALSWKRYSLYSSCPRVLTPRQLENPADDPRAFQNHAADTSDIPNEFPGAFEGFFRSNSEPLALINRQPNSLYLGSWGTPPRSSAPRPRSPPTQRAQDGPPVCTACYSHTLSVLSRAHSQTPAFTLNFTVVPPGGALEPSSLEALIHSGARLHNQIVPCLPCSSASSFHDSPI